MSNLIPIPLQDLAGNNLTYYLDLDTAYTSQGIRLYSAPWLHSSSTVFTIPFLRQNAPKVIDILPELFI